MKTCTACGRSFADRDEFMCHLCDGARTEDLERRVVAAIDAVKDIPTQVLESGALDAALYAAASLAVAAGEDDGAKVSTRSLAFQARQALRALGRLP